VSEIEKVKKGQQSRMARRALA